MNTHADAIEAIAEAKVTALWPYLAAASPTGGMELFRGAALLAATITMGLVAGVFGLYAHTIMPGLRRTDDRTFVGAFQSIDRAIINPWFMASFLGELVLTGLAAALHLGADERSVLPWTASAFVLYLTAVVITLAVNVPRNDAIKAAGPPERIGDLAGVRARFGEAGWAAWNLVRTLASTVAFGCLAWALVVYGGLR
jgi:uncharacterized membrane protein